jgi:ribulose-5-phosphate 4-epimerase/fuculose-1-phosphate aldolase
MNTEAELRDDIVRFGAMLYQKGLAHGSAGNLSVRLSDGTILITPTNSSLGFLEPERISKVSPGGELLSGAPPSKEAFFHLALYEQRPQAGAVVHLHSTHSAAISCLCHDDHTNVLPPLTAYAVMRIGKLPLLPYHPPGDKRLASAVRTASLNHRAMLLANHGPIVSGANLREAIFAYEELEETAKLFFLTEGHARSPLSTDAVAELNATFPS